MPCGLCHNKERSADENKDYLCGRCTCKMIGYDKNQKREFIDSLYLNSREEEAKFLERMFEGTVSSQAPIEAKSAPKILIRKGGNF